MLDAILIFDLDGTLFRTETVTVPAVRGAFAAHGLTPPEEGEIAALIGTSTEDYRRWLAGRCPADLAERVERMAVARELALIPGAGALYDGIPRALSALRAEIATLAICSNGPAAYVEAVLAGCSIAGLFDVVRPRREDDADKSQMVHDLLAEARSLLRGPGVVIGDRWDDIEAAHANGLPAIGAAWGYASAGELDEADLVIDDPRDLRSTALRLLQSVA
ncbi:MAG: HAD family hydrolase [Planctomycetota bacterium]|nr:HAD family hydrolase [Planctomycetota bacterium]